MLFERDSSNRNSKLSSLILLDEDCSSLSYQNRFGREMRIRWHFARINSSALGKFIHSSIGRCLSRCLSFLIVGIDRMARRLEEFDQFSYVPNPLFFSPLSPHSHSLSWSLCQKQQTTTYDGPLPPIDNSVGQLKMILHRPPFDRIIGHKIQGRV